MNDPVFARSVRHGPRTRSFNADEDLVESVWQSVAIDELHGQLVTDDEGNSNGQPGLNMLDDESDIPVVIELFVDGFQPMKTGYQMWVIMLKILNLPHEIANDYIIPIGVVDCSGKPVSLENHFNFIVKQLDCLGGTRISVYDASRDGDQRVYIRPYLLCIACDMRGMKVVACHCEALAKFPCHLCEIEGERHAIPRHIRADGGEEKRGIGTTVYDTTKHLWPQKCRKRAREEAEYAGLVKRKGFATSGLRGFTDEPVWTKLPYFDLSSGFLVCAMHQIANTGKSHLKYVRKMPTGGP